MRFGARNLILALMFLCAVPAQAQLVGYWAADGNANDSSGFENHGTLNGATFTDGVLGEAFQFDGSSNVSINGNGTYQFGTDDFSVAFWVRFDFLQSDRDGMGHKDSFPPGGFPAGGFNGWLFNICSGCTPSGVGFEVRDFPNSFGDDARVLTSFFSTNEWYHLTGVRSGNSLEFYVDGTLLSSVVTATIADVSNDHELNIGSLSSGSRQFFNGAIDEFRLYSHALSQSEVSALATIPEPGPLALLALGLTALLFRRPVPPS